MYPCMVAVDHVHDSHAVIACMRGAVINCAAACCSGGGAGGVRAARCELSKLVIEYPVTEFARVTGFPIAQSA